MLVEAFIDITERKKAEEALKRAYEKLNTTQAQLLQSEKMASLNTIVAGVAHEINTPIGSGVTMASLLLGQAEELRHAELLAGLARNLPLWPLLFEQGVQFRPEGFQLLLPAGGRMPPQPLPQTLAILGPQAQGQQETTDQDAPQNLPHTRPPSPAPAPG